MDHDQVRLALVQAKRVRRETNVLVQMLAQLRDNDTPQPKEAQDERSKD